MGILPAPLLPEPLGALPDEAAGDLKPFFLAFDSLQAHQYFQLAGVSEQELRDLYSEPFFFKAVRADVSDETLQALRQAELKRLEEEQQFVAEAQSRRKQAVESGGEAALDETGKKQLRGDEQREGLLRHTWLLWAHQMAAGDEEPLPDDPGRRTSRLEEMAERTVPRVLARFDNPAGTPYLVARKIQRGDVLLATSGLLSNWNTLPTSNAVVIFDRTLRAMIQSTLPPRNFGPTERIALPLPTGERELTLQLRRPDGGEQAELLDTGFVGKEQLGFSIEQPLARGLYRVTALRANGNGGAAARETAWELPVAVNGDAEESELQPLGRDQFDARVGNAAVRWVGPEDEISLAGTQVSGQDSWWWLIFAVLGLLLVELLLVAKWTAGVARSERGRREDVGTASQTYRIQFSRGHGVPVDGHGPRKLILSTDPDGERPDLRLTRVAPMNEALGWLLGLKNVKSIDEIDPSLAAPWVAGGTFWIFFALAGAAGCGAGVLRQIPASRLAGRAARLGPLPRPAAGLAAADAGRPGAPRVADQRQEAAVVPGVRRHRQHGDRGRVSARTSRRRWPRPRAGNRRKAPRRRRRPALDYLQALLSQRARTTCSQRLADDKHYRVEAFLFDGNNTSQLRKLEAERGGGDDAGPETRRGAADDQRPSHRLRRGR